MDEKEIKKVLGITSGLTFIGAFATYNEMRRNGRREEGCCAVAGKKHMQYVFHGRRWLKIASPVMPKIMFNERFGLQAAVLGRWKTMTRRAVALPKDVDAAKIAGAEMGLDANGRTVATFYGYTKDKERVPLCSVLPRYQPYATVAVAQSYESIVAKNPGDGYGNYYLNQFCLEKGWKNKMFVRSDMMPHQIRITGVRVERLQDISDQDCRREGIIYVRWRQYPEPFSDRYVDHDLWTLEIYREQFEDAWADDIPGAWAASSPQAAFGALIIQMQGRKVWNANPWVWVYEFELVK